MSVWEGLRAFVIVGGAFAGGLLAGAGVVREAVAGTWSDYAGLDTLARALTTIDRRYVEPVAPEQLAHAAVKGMTDALDPYSTYHPPSQWRGLIDEVDSAGAGIGIDLQAGPDGIRVARVVPEGPADLAGVPVGMVVDAVGGEPVSTVREANARIPGPLGEPVTISGRLPSGARSTITVVRDSFEDVRVGGGPLPHSLHYIRIGRFTRGTATRFNQQVARVAEGTRGLVLDLRGNPGGLLSEAGEVADRFLADGLVVETVARGGVVDGTVIAGTQNDDLTLPVVVLMDGQSASAAEVLAGALQARGRAKVVGASSYGKGSVQSVVEFEDGGALRLTTAAYRLPGGRTIDRDHPLEPDIPVAVSAVDSPRARLEQALRTHAPDSPTRDRWLADLSELEDPPHDPQAPAPIPLGAVPAEFVGKDAALDAAIAALGAE
jgi:carboxyl-terminal processing protease